MLEKTTGNPFFGNEFLYSLAEEILLAFDHDATYWHWNLDRIYARGNIDNVVDLVGNLARLPAGAQSAPQRLACLGNTAGIAMLSTVLWSSGEQVHGSLWSKVHQGVVGRSDRANRFVHAPLLEAADSLVPLTAQMRPQKQRKATFEIVGQLNHGAALITSCDERKQSAGFNMLASRSAGSSTANALPLWHLDAGNADCALLTEDSCARRHDQSFPPKLNRAECGQLSVAERRLAALSKRATRTVEQALVASLQMDLYPTLDRSSRAVAVCLDHLRHVGTERPPVPNDEEKREECEPIGARLGGRPIEDLIDWRPMEDAASLSTGVLSKLLRPTWFEDCNLAVPSICMAVNLGLERGNRDASCFAYAIFAGPRFGHYRTAFRFGRLAYELVERRGIKGFEATTYLCFALYGLRWTKHVRASRDMLRRAFEAANRIGDLQSGAYTCCHINSNLLFAGEPLPDVQAEAEQGLAFAGKAAVGLVIGSINAQLALIRMLRGLTLKFGCFDDGQFNERRTEYELSSRPALVIAACWYWIRKLQARYFAGDYATALEAALKAQPLLWTSSSYLEESEHHFYGALTHAACCDVAATAADRQHHLDAVAVYYRQLQIGAENCQDIFENRAMLVGAEMARLAGDDAEAMRLYDRAIRSAQAVGFVHIEALANELAVRFYAAHGLDKIARLYMQDACNGYLRWGADGKVRQLEEIYPHLRAEASTPSATGTIGTSTGDLDLATVIQVSQAVSGEIVPEKLIDTLMRTAIQQAGAERGVLILQDCGQQRIAAEATRRGESAHVELRDVTVRAEALPESILYHVLRTRESVVLDDAVAGVSFVGDPYIRQRQARSILCLPLMNQAKLIGALYLENNLTTHVFAPPRIAVLRLLASQAATSLEYTRLYRYLEQREARMRRLVDANIVGIFIWSLDGRVLEANDAFLRIVGYDGEDLRAGRLRWMDLTPPEWLARDLNERITQNMATGRLEPFEKEYIRKDGSRVPVLIGVASFDDGGDEGVAFVLDLTERKEVEQRLRESYEMLREVSSRRETAREDERKHIAREMHDELGQHLTALRMKASVLAMQLGEERPELVEQTKTLTALVDRTMQVVRGVIASLRPASLDAGIVPALEWLTAEFNRNSRTVCRLCLPDRDLILSEDRAIAFFRLVQEALTNVARHAAADWVTIMLARTPDAYLLEVRDNGQGFDPLVTRKRAFGLVGMEERVLMLNGQIVVVSSPGNGTAIKVSLPIHKSVSA